jgi:hypothetical protein
MLTGRLPFESTGVGGYIGAHLHVAPPPLDLYAPAGSKELGRIVARLLAKAPDDRFVSAEHLAGALAAPGASEIVRPPPIPSTPAASIIEAPPVQRPRRGGLALILLFAALAIGLGIALLVKSLGDDQPRVPRTAQEAEPSRIEEGKRPVVVAEIEPVHEEGKAVGRPVVPRDTPKVERETPKVKTEDARRAEQKNGADLDARPLATRAPAPTTDDEANAIIKATDTRAQLDLCKRTPPDRVATVRLCLIAACELGELALAKAWFATALGRRATHDEAIAGLNECLRRGKDLQAP